MAQFERTIPDAQAPIFLNALYWAHSGGKEYSDTVKDEEGNETPNPVNLKDAAGEAIDDHFKMIIKKYQEKKLREEKEQEIQDSIVDVEIS